MATNRLHRRPRNVDSLVCTIVTNTNGYVTEQIQVDDRTLRDETEVPLRYRCLEQHGDLANASFTGQPQLNSSGLNSRVAPNNTDICELEGPDEALHRVEQMRRLVEHESAGELVQPVRKATPGIGRLQPDGKARCAIALYPLGRLRH